MRSCEEITKLRRATSETLLKSPPVWERKPVSRGRAGRVFPGWGVVAAAALGLMVSYGPIVLATFGLFFEPLQREFHWSRAELSAAVSLSTLLVAIIQPVCGRLADRWGARRIILVSLLLFGSTLLSLSVVRGSRLHFYLCYGFLGLFGAGTTPVPYSRVIARWFRKKRGLALGLSIMGFGIGMTLWPLLAHALIRHMGWRGTYLLFGLLILGGVAPVIGLFLREDPERMGWLPDGRRGALNPTSKEREYFLEKGFSWAQARRTATFWKIAGAFFLVSASVHACLIHLVPLLTDCGLSPERAARVASLFGVAIIVGRLIVGYLLDRFFAPGVVASLFGGVALGLFSLWLKIPVLFPFGAVFLLGLGLGMDTLAYLITRYFGLQALGEIFGYAFSGVLLGGSIGPFLLGMTFHRAGTYVPGLLILILAVSIAIGFILSLKPYGASE